MELYGKLTINNYGQFELENNEYGIVNITGILDEIYTPGSLKESQVYVMVRAINSDNILFEEDGGLYKKIDDDGINSYHVCGNNLDLLLSKYTEDQFLEIVIKKGKCSNNGKKS